MSADSVDEDARRHIPSATHLAEFVMLKGTRRPACVRKHHRTPMAGTRSGRQLW